MSLLSQLHMGKQAEEQQKFGERVSEPWPGGDSGLVPALLVRSSWGPFFCLSPPHPWRPPAVDLVFLMCCPICAAFIPRGRRRHSRLPSGDGWWEM